MSLQPSPGSGTVRFVPSGAGYSGQGVGFPPNLPFLLLLSDTDGTLRAMQVILTDNVGSFS
ncbi:MAG: hypothetical protein M3Y58_01415, partial [Chloroflexota bacterium]|nr:hypothetical protein [Chloroflexota bacterium]